MAMEALWHEYDFTLVLKMRSHEWTWEELEEYSTATLPQFLQVSGQPITLIFDLRHAHWRPVPDFTARIRHLLECLHSPLLHTLLFVVPEKSIGALLEHVFKRYGAPEQTYRVVDSVDETYALNGA